MKNFKEQSFNELQGITEYSRLYIIKNLNGGIVETAPNLDEYNKVKYTEHFTCAAVCTSVT